MSGKGPMIGYIRVSSLDQQTHRHREQLEVDRVFIDKASGKDTNRPQLQALLEYVREADTIVVASMDRLARNVDDLRRIVQEQTKRGVCVRFIKENLTFTGDDESPMADLMLSVLGAVAQFERDLIRERQREGIAPAKQRGAYRGRSKALSDDDVLELHRRVEAGERKTDLARAYGVSRETLYKYLRSTAELHSRSSRRLITHLAGGAKPFGMSDRTHEADFGTVSVSTASDRVRLASPSGKMSF